MFTQYDVTLDGLPPAGPVRLVLDHEEHPGFGRVENLTDADYQNVAGYKTAGRSFYAGAKATM